MIGSRDVTARINPGSLHDGVSLCNKECFRVDNALGLDNIALFKVVVRWNRWFDTVSWLQCLPGEIWGCFILEHTVSQAFSHVIFAVWWVSFHIRRHVKGIMRWNKEKWWTMPNSKDQDFQCEFFSYCRYKHARKQNKTYECICEKRNWV